MQLEFDVRTVIRGCQNYRCSDKQCLRHSSMRTVSSQLFNSTRVHHCQCSGPYSTIFLKPVYTEYTQHPNNTHIYSFLSDKIHVLVCFSFRMFSCCVKVYMYKCRHILRILIHFEPSLQCIIPSYIMGPFLLVSLCCWDSTSSIPSYQQLCQFSK